MAYRNYKNKKSNWRRETDRILAKRQRLADRLQELNPSKEYVANIFGVFEVEKKRDNNLKTLSQGGENKTPCKFRTKTTEKEND